MKLEITPSSGHADSYFDVTFKLSMPQSVDRVEVKIKNTSSNEDIKIIGVNYGFIKGEYIAVFKNAQKLEGYFNIFNKDRMNKKFNIYKSVDLVFEINITNGNEEYTEQRSISFYNESKSLDAEIVPFDLIVQNPSVNIVGHEPLKLDIVSDIEKKYEICIKSDDNSLMCCFSVLASKGRTKIEVPSEIIYADLELDKKENRRKKFKFYSIKKEGITFAKFVNRKYIPIHNSNLSFVFPETMMPEPTKRLDVLGNNLSKDFVLSDRYLVHTHKDYSSFGEKTSFNDRKLKYLTRFFFEAQNMIHRSKSSDELEGKELEIKNNIMLSELHRKSRVRRSHIASMSDQEVIKAFSGPFIEKYTASVRDGLSYSKNQEITPSKQNAQTESFNNSKPLFTKGNGCSSCLRKKGHGK